MAEVKFCGLTRADDALIGASMGAAFLGVVFAGGPRRCTARQARALFEAAAMPTSQPPARVPRRVGVFGAQSAAEIVAMAQEAELDVIQLHGHSGPAVVGEIRRQFGGDVWRVLRVRGRVRDHEWRTAADGVDAVVLDALVEGVLGGTGMPLDWASLAETFGRSERPSRLVLAGGLRPANVARAVALLAPDVVDVSSGVESAPGIKDHALMRAFAEAAASGGP